MNMSVDTTAKLIGKVEPEQILNFIKSKYDKSAKSDIKIDNMGEQSEFDFVNDHYGDSENWLITRGSIDFKNGNDCKSLFYVYDNINSYENLEFYKEYNLEDMVKAETTSLILGKWGNSVEIMKSIVEEFGGWLDEDDCDDEEYYFIQGKKETNFKPLRRVTMQEVYDKFGEEVIIVDR